MKTSKNLVLSIAFVFLFVGSALALPFNERPIDFGGGTDGELDFQQILDKLTPTDGEIDAYWDQNEAALWQKETDFDTDAYSITMLGPWDGTFGVYSDSTEYEYDLLNVTAPDPHADGGLGDPSDYEATFYVKNGMLYKSAIDFQKEENGIAGFNSFGFYFRRADNGITFYTEDDRNNSSGYTPDHTARALAYLLEDGQEIDTAAFLRTSEPATIDYTEADGSNDWLLAFEAGSDGDFQDAIFLVEDMTPVPEPATMVLLGLGLIGLGTFGRKKGLFAKK